MKSQAPWNPDDPKGWVVGFHGEWSGGLASTMLPEMLADAQSSRLDGRSSMEETPRSHGPTAILASEQDTNGHTIYSSHIVFIVAIMSDDGDQLLIKLNALGGFSGGSSSESRTSRTSREVTSAHSAMATQIILLGTQLRLIESRYLT